MNIQPFIRLCDELNLTPEEISQVSAKLMGEATERQVYREERKAELRQTITELHPLFQILTAPYFPKQ